MYSVNICGSSISEGERASCERIIIYYVRGLSERCVLYEEARNMITLYRLTFNRNTYVSFYYVINIYFNNNNYCLILIRIIDTFLNKI